MKKLPKLLPQALSLCLLLAAASAVIAQTPPPAGNPPGSPQPGAAGAPAVPPGADPAPPPTTDQISYLFGLTFGAQMHSAGINNEVAIDAIARGLKAGLQ